MYSIRTLDMYSMHPPRFETGKDGAASDDNKSPMDCKVHRVCARQKAISNPILHLLQIVCAKDPQCAGFNYNPELNYGTCHYKAEMFVTHTHTLVESLVQTVLLRACSDSQTLTLTVTWKSHRTAKLKCATSIYGVTS